MGSRLRVVALVMALLVVQMGCSRSDSDEVAGGATSTTRPPTTSTSAPSQGGTSTTIDLSSATFCQLMAELRRRVEGLPNVIAEDRSLLVPELHQLYQESGPLFDELAAKAPAEIRPQAELAMRTLAEADQQTLLVIENDPQSLPEFAVAAIAVRDWSTQNCPGLAAQS